MQNTNTSFLFLLVSQAPAPPLPETDIYIHTLTVGDAVSLSPGRNMTEVLSGLLRSVIFCHNRTESLLGKIQ